MEALKSKIKTIIVKTIIASVPTVTSLSKSHCKYRHTCHELFGFDIFLDQNLKPWLFEVRHYVNICFIITSHKFILGDVGGRDWEEI